MFILHHAVTGWLMAPLLLIHLAFGLLAGLLYFRALRRATNLLAEGGAIAHALTMGACRFGSLGCLLLLSALEGAWPLLAVAAGVLLARHAILHWTQESPA